MSDLSKALEGLSPMLRDKIARQIKAMAWDEVSRMKEELAHWNLVPAGQAPGPARAEMDAWELAARRLAEDAQEVLFPRKHGPPQT